MKNYNSLFSFLFFFVSILFFSACTPKVTPPTSPENPTPDTPTTTPTPSSGMTGFEMEMLKEINDLRTNPSGYIGRVKEYVAYFKNEGFDAEDTALEESTANGLITVLRNTNPMSALKSHAPLYEVAKKHGLDLKNNKRTMSGNPHKGSDGSMTGSRLDAGTDLKEGAENIGSYHKSPRWAMISLLVDSGVPGFGHRKNLLDPRWEFGAFYYIDKVGEDENVWVQMFGAKSKNAETPNNTSTNSLDEVNKAIDKAGYLTEEEKEMIREINSIRTNPQGYISKIERHIARVQRGDWLSFVSDAEEIAMAKETIAELKKLAPLTPLMPDKNLFSIAQTHGNFLKGKGNIDTNGDPHRGKNGASAHQRISASSAFSAGGENFVGGRDNVKDSVIDLLVDAGIDNRGHRKAILNPSWRFVACYKVGAISTSSGLEQKNNWLQNFAK